MPIANSTFFPLILELSNCHETSGLRDAFLSITQKLGFSAVLYGGRFGVDVAKTKEHVESNYDRAWRQHYDANHYAAIDPTVRHAIQSLAPLGWSLDIYASREQLVFREEATAYGLRSGITFPVHSRDGDVGLLSLSMSSASSHAVAHLEENKVWGSLLATMMHETTRRLIKTDLLSSRPHLTKCEAEVLKWLSAGKSNWDISVLLNISEHGVSHHVRNLLTKFDVPTRRQAVVKAILLGVI
jgi:LuxR family quorum-sensing transcriptional regulator LasR